MRILLVEPDDAAATEATLALTAEGFDVERLVEGGEALLWLEDYTVKVVITETVLPDISGLSFLNRLRRAKNATPVLFLSSCSDIETRVKALSSGADDYMTKPFSPRELSARLYAVARRAAGAATSVIEVADFKLDLAEKLAYVGGNKLRLTGKEFACLELLALNIGKTVTKTLAMDHLYGGLDEPHNKIFDVFICKLRKKIREAGGTSVIETVWGYGFRLVAPQAIEAA